jgi:hypothetical protein
MIHADGIGGIVLDSSRWAMAWSMGGGGEGIC